MCQHRRNGINIQEPHIKTDLKLILSMFKTFKFLYGVWSRNRILWKRKTVSKIENTIIEINIFMDQYEWNISFKYT